MKICYLLMAHDGSEQLGRLVARLSGRDTSFVVHVDAKIREEPFRAAVRE